MASFTKAGYALKNANIPGIGAVSFGPGQAYATGPVTIFKYDPTSKTLVPASNSGTNDPAGTTPACNRTVGGRARGWGRPRTSVLR